jgi:hypothetical protein
MTQEIINTGSLPNDGAGDPLRTAFQKINNNFEQLYSTNYNSQVSYSVGNTAQAIFETPLVEFTQGKFQINTLNTSTNDSQDVMISAAVVNNLTKVRFVAHGTLFNGNALTNYSMDIDSASGNVRLLVNPFTTAALTHLVSYEVTYLPTIVGLNMALDGYGVGDLIITQDDLVLLTESTMP